MNWKASPPVTLLAVDFGGADTPVCAPTIARVSRKNTSRGPIAFGHKTSAFGHSAPVKARDLLPRTKPKGSPGKRSCLSDGLQPRCLACPSRNNRYSPPTSMPRRSRGPAEAGRQIKWDTVPVNSQRKSLKTNEPRTKQVRHSGSPRAHRVILRQPPASSPCAVSFRRTAQSSRPRNPSCAPPPPPAQRRSQRGAVTFCYLLYSNMNMNRNPRNPLKTNDRCTLYSKTKRVFTGTATRQVSGPAWKPLASGGIHRPASSIQNPGGILCD